MKKVGRILVIVLLVVSITWAAVASLLLYREKQDSGAFKPVVTQASNDDRVGQWRLPKLWEPLKLNKTEDFVDLEFIELEKSAYLDSLGKIHDALHIKITLREKVSYDENLLYFSIYRYCPEDGFWYEVYYPNFTPINDRMVSGEIIKKYLIPPDILEEPGRYAFGLQNLGTCSFEVE